MPNKNEMLLSAGFQRKGMCANVHYKPSCFHIFSPLYMWDKRTPAWKKQFLMQAEAKHPNFWSPNDLRSTFTSQSGETLHNGAKRCFWALLSLLELMAKPLLGHSQTHLQKLFSWHWGHSEISRDGKPDCLCHSVMVWSRGIPPCVLSSLWS